MGEVSGNTQITFRSDLSPFSFLKEKHIKLSPKSPNENKLEKMNYFLSGMMGRYIGFYYCQR